MKKYPNFPENMVKFLSRKEGVYQKLFEEYCLNETRFKDLPEVVRQSMDERKIENREDKYSQKDLERYNDLFHTARTSYGDTLEDYMLDAWSVDVRAFFNQTYDYDMFDGTKDYWWVNHEYKKYIPPIDPRNKSDIEFTKYDLLEYQEAHNQVISKEGSMTDEELDDIFRYFDDNTDLLEKYELELSAYNGYESKIADYIHISDREYTRHDLLWAISTNATEHDDIYAIRKIFAYFITMWETDRKLIIHNYEYSMKQLKGFRNRSARRRLEDGINQLTYKDDIDLKYTIDDFGKYIYLSWLYNTGDYFYPDVEINNAWIEEFHKYIISNPYVKEKFLIDRMKQIDDFSFTKVNPCNEVKDWLDNNLLYKAKNQ